MLRNSRVSDQVNSALRQGEHWRHASTRWGGGGWGSVESASFALTVWGDVT